MRAHVSSKAPHRTLVTLSVIFVLFVILGPVTAQSATYYVATTGNDTNPGTSQKPWLTIQRCFSSGLLVAGDVCEVADGTYTSTTSGRVVNISPTSPQGQPGNPIILRAANRHGAIIEAPNSWPGVDCEVVSCPFAGIMITNRQYYVIEGFQFTRPGSYYSTKASSSGITLFGASNIVIRYNHFHDIGRNVCHNGLMGQVGVFAQSPINLLFENNIFNTIGRLRNGENGCVTDKFQHDHGIYIENGTETTIQRNIFYDVNRGMAINLKARVDGTKTLRTKIFHNLFSGKAPDGRPGGHIALTNVLDDIQIKNNIFHDPPGGYAIWWSLSSTVASGPGLVLQKNLTNSTNSEKNLTNPYMRPLSGITAIENLMNTNPGLTSGSLISASTGLMSTSTNNFSLAPSSPAIDAGVDVGLPFSGSAPDIGAFEFSDQEGKSPVRPAGLQIR